MIIDHSGIHYYLEFIECVSLANIMLQEKLGRVLIKKFFKKNSSGWEPFLMWLCQWANRYPAKWLQHCNFAIENKIVNNGCYLTAEFCGSVLLNVRFCGSVQNH